MHVCMIYICKYMCILCMHVYIWIYVCFNSIHVCMHIIYICECVCVCRCVCVSVYVCIDLDKRLIKTGERLKINKFCLFPLLFQNVNKWKKKDKLVIQKFLFSFFFVIAKFLCVDCVYLLLFFNIFRNKHSKRKVEKF